MKRVAIVYFSGTGNTWWVSKTLARQLGTAGVDASVHSIEQLSPFEADALVHEADAVTFGYMAPTYQYL